mmetsp:Transcript_25635/g.86156  ORF Transcript_25635/g.86156 Transcript_25635/m.86156 type:complete len:222 (+) Transcript_25635:1601-2266(+)
MTANISVARVCGPSLAKAMVPGTNFKSGRGASSANSASFQKSRDSKLSGIPNWTCEFAMKRKNALPSNPLRTSSRSRAAPRGDHSGKTWIVWFALSTGAPLSAAAVAMEHSTRKKWPFGAVTMNVSAGPISRSCKSAGAGVLLPRWRQEKRWPTFVCWSDSPPKASKVPTLTSSPVASPASLPACQKRSRPTSSSLRKTTSMASRPRGASATVFVLASICA